MRQPRISIPQQIILTWLTLFNYVIGQTGANV